MTAPMREADGSRSVGLATPIAQHRPHEGWIEGSMATGRPAVFRPAAPAHDHAPADVDAVLERLGLAPAPRQLTADDRRRFEVQLGDILGALGLDLDTPSTRDTPRRLLSALIEATDGYEGDPKLVTAFETECRGGADCELAQIVEGPIPFSSLCEHHALPFVGEAWVGYIAHERILGISKLTRLVRVVARRFAVQERVTHDIADALVGLTNAHGVAVYVVAEHMCAHTRGVREPATRTRTTAYRGAFEHDAGLRAEFRDLAGIGRGEQ
jgi:GTP cyclohydrolase I